MRELVLKFYDRLWNAWDDTAVETVLAKTFAFRGSLAVETTGRNSWRKYRDHVRRGSPDFTNEIIDLVVEPGRAAARLRYSGTHQGALLGIPATGRRFAYHGAAFFAGADGLLAEAWVLGDLDSLRRQLT